MAEKYPALGEIDVGTSLNVRTSADKETSKVLGRLKRGEKVVVLGEEGEYYRLQYPKQMEAWVASWFLMDNGQGQTDKISRDNINIRSGSSMQYPVIARVSKGAEVQIIEVSANKWVKIAPPANAYAYAAKKFVKLGENYEAYLAKEKDREAAQVVLENAKKTFDKHNNLKTITQVDYDALLKDFDSAIKTLEGTPDAAEGAEYRARLEKLRDVAKVAEEQEKARQIHETKTTEVVTKVNEKINEILAESKPAALPKYEYEGWVDEAGGILYRPATHKLKGGDRVLYYLKSNGQVNLDDYVGKQVGINGKMQSIKAGWARMVIVEEIQVIQDATATASMKKAFELP